MMNKRKNRAHEIAQELIRQIFARVKDLSDAHYVDCLEEVAGACEDSARVKRQEMEKVNE